jgi:hypothetical protein
MSVNEVLSAGFSAANQRLGGVFLDLLWKIAWALLSGAALFLLVSWISSQLGSIQTNGPLPLQNPVALALLTRELWNRYAASLFWMVVLLIGLSKTIWVLLEAYFRAGILSVDGSFFQKASRHFRLFIASSVMKSGFAAIVGALLLLIVFGRYLSAPVADWNAMWPETRPPFLVALVIWIAIWFALTLFETLFRSGSFELLGTDLFTVVGLIGTLVIFEAMIMGAAIVGVLAVASIATGPVGVLIKFAVSVLAVLGLTVLHSYLLLVRFSSVTALESEAVIIGHVDV